MTYIEVIDHSMLQIVASSFFICLILIFKNKNPIHTKRLLLVAVFGMYWYCLIFVLTREGLIRKCPYIFGWGIPVYYTFPVCCYLYVRGLLYRETKLKNKDWLHFIPAALSLIVLAPFYSLGIKAKQELVDAMTANIDMGIAFKIGLVPNSWHFIVRSVQGAVYVVFQWILLFPIIKNKRPRLPYAPRLKRWLILFTALETLLYAGLAFTTVVGYRHLTDPGGSIFPWIEKPAIFTAIICLTFYVTLFFYPEFLYGKPAKPPFLSRSRFLPNEGGRPKPGKEPLLTPQQVSEYVRQLETHILNTGIYRRLGLNIHLLAVDLAMSPRHLSYVLNTHYRQTFSEFINAHRVEYVKDRLKEGGWRRLSLEGLGREAGFASRTTFFTAFKKHTGLSPAVYIRSVRVTGA